MPSIQIKNTRLKLESRIFHLHKIFYSALRKDLLRYWDETQGKFLHPSGTYTIMVGASSADIRLQQSLTIDMNQ